jgi:methyl acetate hydrolase
MPSPEIDSVLSSAVESGRVPGVVAALTAAAGTTYQSVFGTACADSRRPITFDAIFRIASMTKLVTSVAIMRLVDEGAIDLDATMSDYVPGFVQPEVLVEFDADTGGYVTRPATRDATLRELLSHTGGYGYWFLHEPLRIASGKSPDLMNPPFLIADPGAAFAYSTSHDVIGQLVEPVTGMPLDAYLQVAVFEPLGMVDTGFALPAEKDRLVRVHRRAGNGFKVLPLETGDHPVRGGGGLYSTAGDYTRLLRCLLGRGVVDGVRVLPEAATVEVGRNQIGELEARMPRSALAERTNDFIFMDGTQKFGFGVMVETRDREGWRSRGAYGWGGIFNTYFWVDPERDLAGLLLLQLAPFANRASVDLLNAFESAVYAA